MLLLTLLTAAGAGADGPRSFSPVVHAVLNEAEMDGPVSAQPAFPDDGSADGFSDRRSAVKAPVDPTRAMLHSLALPGWGQLDNDRRDKAFIMIAAEAIFVGGYAYEAWRLANEDMTPLQRDLVRTDRNSFILYWMLTKVVGMVDAYVDAHLSNFDVSDLSPPGIESMERPDPVDPDL